MEEKPDLPNVKIVTIGDSLGIIIPKGLAEHLELQKGDKVNAWIQKAPTPSFPVEKEEAVSK